MTNFSVRHPKDVYKRQELNDGYITISAAKGLDKDEKDKTPGKYIRKERYACLLYTSRCV